MSLKGIPLSVRSLSREFVFKFLYHTIFESDKDLSELTIENVKNEMGLFENSIDLPTDKLDRDFIASSCHLALTHHSEIKILIEKYLRKWKWERINSIDKTILIAAISEMNYQKDIPHPVIINEYLDLAKKYGNENSKNFINGTLDNISKNEF